MSSTSSTSLDHNRNQSIQLPTGGSTSSKSSSCSSVSSHRSDERVYSAPPPPPPPPSLPLLYFNPFSHLLQSSCTSNHDKLLSSSFDERYCSTSTSPQSPLAIPENNQCSSSSSSTPLHNNIEDREEDENIKPQCLIKQRPCSR
jgi:hypothetical protein